MTTLEGQTLARTIILALERMAFVLTEEVAEDQAVESEPYGYHAVIGFTGQGQDVKLFLAASEEFLLEFTANLLGLEEKEVDLTKYAPQAMSEMANVIGEEVIVMLGGTETDYSLGVAEQIDESGLEAMLEEEERPLTCYLESEGAILRAQILMKESEAS